MQVSDAAASKYLRNGACLQVKKQTNKQKKTAEIIGCLFVAK